VTELLEWAPLFAVTIAALALWRSIVSDRSKDNKAKFRELHDRLDGKAESMQVGLLAAKIDIAEDKITVIQNDLKHLPDKDVTHRLELVIGELRSEVGKLSEQVKPIAHMANRMQEAILEKVMG
jgi:hypothetical protein